jgi:hypothetical protein
LTEPSMTSITTHTDKQTADEFRDALTVFLHAARRGAPLPEQMTRLANARVKAEKLPHDLYRAAIAEAFDAANF